ncbi:ribosomal protein L4/L1e [Isosphaera pallida ATCC 43644]|uniref:Large ribosomal subunit protein uL4 n=1 Tax=Isosphaera pallida (strain ATCC 43644 / DSM 9630 / IS1B) TaxID=575540 RepID=E8R3S5_ISOPI|nr:50S ribosomal protein L4 [Isosphaera pallida]ADV62660.1 ribosomal protein L4/L1e [Isosphaera pallida ATCC 43644]
MVTVPVYDREGRKVGEETIDPADFGGVVKKQLLHDVVLMHLAARRVGTVNTRGRADVAGSGKKLFRQKGTGNARVGSKRTNKRKGGGVAFARRNRNYRYTLPKRAVRAAIRMAVLSKFLDHQALIVEDLPINRDAPKTRDVAALLRALPRPDLNGEAVQPTEGEPKSHALKRTLDHRSVLIGLPAHDPIAWRAARNVEGVMVAPVAEFNTYDILKQRYLLLTRPALEALKQRAKTMIGRRPALAVAAASPTTASEA